MTETACSTGLCEVPATAAPSDIHQQHIDEAIGFRNVMGLRRPETDLITGVLVPPPNIDPAAITKLREEWQELNEAFLHREMVYHRRINGIQVPPEAATAIDVAVLKELTDVVYVAYQVAAAMGWDLDEALRRVHHSNMTKLGEDGKPQYDSNGCVIKGPNYQPPNIEPLVLPNGLV